MTKERKDCRQQLCLKDVIDIKEWQKIQDNFSLITGIGLRTIGTKNHPITIPSHEPRLCSELLKDNPARSKVCGLCLPTFLGGRGIVDRNLSFVCYAGLHNFVTPLRVDGQVFGYFVVGPVVLVMRKTKEQYRRISDELNLDLEEFWKAFCEIKVVSFQVIQSLLELIKIVGEYTLKVACSRGESKQHKVAVIAPEPVKLARLLEVLLDVTFQVSGADVGSIMFFDQANEVLIIKNSRGIPEDIVRNTRVRLGEGISGIVAKERNSLLIDSNFTDNRIKPYLNRPNLSSAMVVPISIEKRIWGVMNLGVLKTSPVKFDNEKVLLINKLVDLAAVALQ